MSAVIRDEQLAGHCAIDNSVAGVADGTSPSGVRFWKSRPPSRRKRARYRRVTIA
jgi:hypothetical protein